MNRASGLTRSALAALAVGLLVLLTSLPFWLSPHLVEEGDLAANALQTERAREGRELLGPYSRYKFHHPGPVSFYGQVAAEPFFAWLPSLLARHLAGQLVVNLALVVWVLRLLGRGGLDPRLTAPGVFLVIAPVIFLSGGNAMMLASVWGPRLVIFPMVLFVVAVARFWDGDAEAFSAAAVGGTIAYHTHLLTIPLIGVGILVSAVVAVVRMRRNQGFDANGHLQRHLVIGTAAWGVGLAPVLFEQATGRPGNITLLWLFARDHQAPVHPWSDVLHYLGQAWTDPIVVLWRWSGFDGNSPVISLLVIGFLVAVSVVQFRRSERAWQLVLAAIWGALLIAFVQARYTYGDLSAYFFSYLYGLVGVLNLVVARELRDRWPARRANRKSWFESAAVSAGLVGLGFWLAFHPINPPPPRDRLLEASEFFALTTGAAVHLELGPGPSDRKLWPQLPAFALGLRRAGARVTVDSQLVFMCGEEMQAQPGARPDVALVFTNLVPADSGLSFLEMGDWAVVSLPAATETADLLLLMRERDQR